MEPIRRKNVNLINLGSNKDGVLSVKIIFKKIFLKYVNLNQFRIS